MEALLPGRPPTVSTNGHANGQVSGHPASATEVRRFTGHRVQLAVFEGPLDLLLHLIKHNRYDIFEIPIREITEQYLIYLRLLELLDFEIAGDFLVVAAELLVIKSKLLLPPEEEAAAESEAGADPRLALAERLVEYQRYREAADTLRGYHELRARMFPRLPGANGNGHQGQGNGHANGNGHDDGNGANGHGIAKDRVLLMHTTSLFDLLYAFQRVLDRTREAPPVLVRREPMSVPDRMRQLGQRIREATRGLTFDELCDDCELRLEVIVTFLALLELILRQRVTVEQPEAFGEIRIHARSRRTAESARRLPIPTGAEALVG